MEIRTLFLLQLLVFTQVSAKIPISVRVGSVFLEKEQDVHGAFQVGVKSLKTRHLLNETDIEFDIQYATLNDFFHLYTRACVELGYGIISLFGPSDPTLDVQLESISTSLGIPLISTAPRKSGSVLPEQTLTLSLHPTQVQMMSLIKDLATQLGWKDISIIHDPLYGVLETSSLAEKLQMLGTVSVHHASADLRATLVQLRLKGARNIIIDTGVENVENVIQATLDTGMMTKAYSYIFTMLDMRSGNWSRLSYSQALVFGFNILDEKKLEEIQKDEGLEKSTRVGLTLDAVEVLARGLEGFDNSGTDLSPPAPASTSCAAEKKWELGEELRDAFTSVNFDGVSGPIAFTNGVRSKLSVDILKLQYEDIESPSFLPVGKWTEGLVDSTDGIKIFDKNFMTNEKPAINKTLIISISQTSSCYERFEDGVEKGFCVDLARELSSSVGFNYNFRPSTDGRYGKPDPLTGQWDGIIGDVLRGEADLALGDLTVTAARQAVVDFSNPLFHTSIKVLYKKGNVPRGGLGSFATPFSCWVWLSIVVAFICTAFVLRFVAWVSPWEIKEESAVAGSERGNDPLGNNLSWANSAWILASTLVLRGTSFRLQALSTRTIAIVWWLFSLAILIIYGSLIAEQFDSNLESENLESLLRNPAFEFGVLQDGATNGFLSSSKREDIQRIWWRILKAPQTSLFSSIEEGIEAVKGSNGNFGFVAEEQNLMFAAESDCSLGLIGPLDARSFAIAMQKGSGLRESISQGILRLGENGVLRQLEEKWWGGGGCNGKKIHQVPLNEFVGPLTILVFGLTAAVLIALAERIFHHRRSHRGFFRTATENGNGNGKIAMNDTESDE